MTPRTSTPDLAQAMRILARDSQSAAIAEAAERLEQLHADLVITYSAIGQMASKASRRSAFGMEFRAAAARLAAEAFS